MFILGLQKNIRLTEIWRALRESLQPRLFHCFCIRQDAHIRSLPRPISDSIVLLITVRKQYSIMVNDTPACVTMNGAKGERKTERFIERDTLIFKEDDAYSIVLYSP